MEPHDLVLAELARGSARDHEYADAVIAAGVLDRDTLVERAAARPLGGAQIASIDERPAALLPLYTPVVSSRVRDAPLRPRLSTTHHPAYDGTGVPHA